MINIRDRSELAKIAELVAAEAAQLVMGGYRSRPHADQKGRGDLVTEFDRASQDLLMTRLASLAPGIPIVGEEGEAQVAPRTGPVWYVDPIDGTTNFVHGHPFWCVAVGLMDDDVPVAGAVVAPAIDVRWIGWTSTSRAPEDEGHALRNGKRCLVSETGALSEALVATGFPPNREKEPDNNFASFIAVKRVVQAVRRCGSAAMDICLVADGTYDGYWERSLHPWDTVAASAILMAARGKVSTLSNAPADHHAGHILATNGRIHAELAGILNG